MPASRGACADLCLQSELDSATEALGQMLARAHLRCSAKEVGCGGVD
jgi:hypothetical protein